MVAKHGADPALWKHLQEQEKILAVLRECGAPPANVQPLEQYTLSTSRELGRIYFAREEDEPLDDRRAQLVYVMLRKLSPRRREVFRLYRVERLTYAGIAALLNVKVDTVKDDLACALVVFAHELTQLESERSRREDT
jgi:RNA polymerase sigma factor (sigma-70 family)